MPQPIIEMNVYIGAHRTAAEHLRYIAKSNHHLLQDQKIAFASKTLHEAAIKEALDRIEGGADPDKVREVFLLALAKGDHSVKRVIILGQDLCGTLTRPTGGSVIYPRIRNTVQKLRTIMGNQRFRLFMGTRSPASFLPSCYSAALMSAHQVSFEDYIGDTDVNALHWSDCIDRLNKALYNAEAKASHAGIFVWRYEDYPMMWRTIFYALTGISNPMALQGSTDPLNVGLSLEGARYMHKFLEAHKMPTTGAFDKVKTEFLKKFPSTKPPSEDSFWTNEKVAEMNFNYEDDWYFIERMENVRALSHPRLYK